VRTVSRNKVLSEFLIEIDYHRSAKKATVHGTRLKFFRNDLEVKTEVLQQLSFQDGEYCVVDKTLYIRVHEGEAQLLIKWRGFDEEEPTLENVAGGCTRTGIRLLADMRDNSTPRQQRIAKHA